MAVVALCAWAARISWAPDHEDDGDNIRARVVEARDEYDAMRAEIARLKAEMERCRIVMNDALAHHQGGHSRIGKALRAAIADLDALLKKGGG